MRHLGLHDNEREAAHKDDIMLNGTRIRRLFVVALAVLFASAVDARAQFGPPVHPQMQPEGDPGTGIYGVAHVVAEGTVAGVKGIGHLTKALFGKGDSGVDPFGGLREGTTVVVRPDNGKDLTEAVRFDENAGTTTEGMVTQIDRGRREISVRFDDRRVEVFKLANVVTKNTDRMPPTEGSRVIVFYREGAGAGEPVPHFFDKVAKKQ